MGWCSKLSILMSLPQLFMRPPARSFTSVSMLSDGSGPVEMNPLGQLGEDGRVKRVSASTAPTVLGTFFLVFSALLIYIYF